MSDNKPKADITPIKLQLDSNFTFECHPGVKCFTKCCRGIDIMLTPYDIIRLKNKLELSSEEFLAIYTDLHLLEKTDIPVVTLKLLDDDIKSCPFVKDEGCIIYEDRPTTCRYYPVGVGSLSHKEGSDDTEFYFFVNEPHCLGFEEKKKWTVREWREDQGVDIHDDINAGWTDLLVKKRSFPSTIKLTEKSKQMFFLACYNIDKFRRFVFESTFLKVYDIDQKIIEKIKDDEIELLRFGFKWLNDILFNKDEKEFQINKETAEKRASKKEA